ncbi:hypothetical protein WA1_50125 [Scytonema hofmannii PCC 7110]|uniref:Uncharacterized protein n=1 Tax=Scytonema hofmannii PCC 7110 TaxID=128403 RepID=A0A139WR27_9CYAN|nr:helix-turn-helix domain-containing protein [Scytonema hofmannii]KYC34886.1 hypothetical protein WA1_50125 [Scytonema hofmannii PCC 7110]
MSRSKEQAKTKTPLHLRLTAEDWEECCKTLNPAEIKVFIWIRASDPYGDRDLEINCSELGKRLGLHKSSVSRALRSLDEKKLIEIELEQVRVKQKISNRRLTLLCKEENGSEREKIEEKETVAPAQRKMHQRNSKRTSATQDAPVQQQTHQCNTQRTESSHSKDSSTPQTIQTYSDFIQTLSDEERASFLNFCLEKTKNLSQEVNDIEAWLAHTTKAGQNRWEVYYEKFTSHQQKQASKSKSNLNSQVMKKFTEEMEQKYQQAQANWQKSQAESCETGGTA